MPEDLISSSIDESGMTMTYDLAFTRVMAGSADEIRPRLADALERLGFHVLEEQPLLAKRRVSKLSTWGCSGFVLDTPTNLLVALKASGANATRVTFNYTIRHAWLKRGDRRTIAREVDAAVALAALSSQPGACGLCGTEAADDSRFCRRCGAPLATFEPAELDAMRLTAGGEAAYSSIGAGTALAGLAFLVVLASVLAAWLPAFAGPGVLKLLKVLSVLGASFGVAGLSMLFHGIWRLHRTLNAKSDEKEFGAAAARRRSVAASRTAQLGPAPEAVSVTEHTTELLEEAAEPRKIRLAARPGKTG